MYSRNQSFDRKRGIIVAAQMSTRQGYLRGVSISSFSHKASLFLRVSVSTPGQGIRPIVDLSKYQLDFQRTMSVSSDSLYLLKPEFAYSIIRFWTLSLRS